MFIAPTFNPLEKSMIVTINCIANLKKGDKLIKSSINPMVKKNNDPKNTNKIFPN